MGLLADLALDFGVEMIKGNLMKSEITRFESRISDIDDKLAEIKRNGEYPSLQEFREVKEKLDAFRDQLASIVMRVSELER
jgi:predicted  nucleic acid-binding Zn-ribbon protein